MLKNKRVVTVCDRKILWSLEIMKKIVLYHHGRALKSMN